MSKMSKKIIAAVVAVVLAATMICVFAACNNDGGTDSDNFKLVVGLDASFPPYGYEENGEIVGFDIDLAKEVCKRNGWEFQAQPIDWDAKDFELNAETINCIWNGFTMTGREDEYTWSEAYVDNSQVIVVKADSGIESLKDLEGKTLIVQTDSSAESALNGDDLADLKASLKQIDSVKEYNTAFLNLDAGAADAIAMDIGVAEYQLENRDGKYIILDEQLATEQYAVGFKLGNTELRDKVQSAIDDMMEDGTFKQIAETWGLTDSVIIK